MPSTRMKRFMSKNPITGGSKSGRVQRKGPEVGFRAFCIVRTRAKCEAQEREPISRPLASLSVALLRSPVVAECPRAEASVHAGDTQRILRACVRDRALRTE